MTGLSRGVGEEVWVQGFDAVCDGGPVADVQLMVLESGMLAKEALLVPTGVSLGAEEVSAHVVVDAVDLPAVAGEGGDDF